MSRHVPRRDPVGEEVTNGSLFVELLRSTAGLPSHTRRSALYWLRDFESKIDYDQYRAIRALGKFLSNVRTHPELRAGLLAYLGDAAPSLDGYCLWCLEELPKREPGRAGRRALYCGPNHRQDACRARRRTDNSAIANPGGRPGVVDAAKRRVILTRRAEGRSLREIAREVGVSTAVVHREVRITRIDQHAKGELR